MLGWLRKASPLLLCVSVLAIATLLTFSAVLKVDKAERAGRYDVYRYFGPQAYYMDYVLHQGELPLWNPLTYCGMPFAANPQVAFFYPPNLVRSLLTFHPTPFKTQVGLIVLMGLHLLLAGTGTFFLARSHKLSYGASFTAAIAFTFSALMVRRVCEYHFISAIGWLPVLLLIVKHALSTSDLRRRVFLGLLLGLVFGISLLGGFLQVAVYMGVSLAAYVIVYRMLHIGRRDVQPSARLGKTLCGDALTVGLLCLVGIGVAAAMVLPCAELASFGARTRDDANAVSDYSPDITPRYFWESMIVYAGRKFETETIRGAGIGILALALVGLTHARRRDVALYFVLFLVLLDCTLGAPFPVATLLGWVTPFKMVSSTRAFDLALLPLAVLAGFGVDAASAQLKSRWLAGLRGVAIAAVGVAMLVPLTRWTQADYYLPVSRLVIVAPAATVAAALCIGIIRYPKAWRLVFPLLIFGETLCWTKHYVPHLVKRKNFTEWAGVYEGGEPFWQDNRRGTDLVENRHLYALKPAINGYDPLHIARVRNVLASPVRTRKYTRLVRHEEVTADNQWGNLFLKRSFWLAQQYVDGPLPDKRDLFPSTTTVFLEGVHGLPVPKIARSDLPNRSVSEDAITTRLEVPAASPFTQREDGSRKCRIPLPVTDMPETNAALCVRCKSTCQAFVKAWFHDPTTGRSELGKTYKIGHTRGRQKDLEFPLPDFSQLKATITIETKHPTARPRLTEKYLQADQADEDDLISILERGPNSVELDVGDLPDYRILTLLDAAYPGWEAYVNGEQVPIYLANDAFKAIVLPPGTHHVQFVFRPRPVYLGLTISSASILLVLLVLLHALTRQLRHR